MEKKRWEDKKRLFIVESQHGAINVIEALVVLPCLLIYALLQLEHT